MEIKVKKGLDLPTKSIVLEEATPRKTSAVAVDLSFINLPLRLLVKQGDYVKKGQPLIQDKTLLKRQLLSPVSGEVQECKRGLKRKLLQIVLTPKGDQATSFPSLNIDTVSEAQLLDRLLEMGGFFRIQARPFCDLANPARKPAHIFIKCLESAPLSLPMTEQLKSNEELFNLGFKALQKLCPNVHLVCDEDHMQEFEHRVVMKGKYPKSSLSIAIERIAPIYKTEDVIWTLDLYDTICIGAMIRGELFNKKRVAVFDFDQQKAPIYTVEDGVSIASLVDVMDGTRVLSSHPMVGEDVGPGGFLGFHDFQFTLLKNDERRPLFHFMRLATKHFSSFPAYPFRKNHFSTNLNGEVRAFIDGSIYQSMMPLNIPVMHLIQALMAKNYEKAIELGLLEVGVEDFVLPSFICPSKIDMVQIIKQGLLEAKAEMLD